MEDVPGIFAMLCAFCVPTMAVSILLFIGLRARRLLPSEEGRTPLYTRTTAGYIGHLRYGGPFIHVRLYDDMLVLGLVKPIVFTYDQLDELEVLSGLRYGLRLHHHHPTAPKRISLSMLDHKELTALIEQRQVAHAR
jgi:hypothetical protein